MGHTEGPWWYNDDGWVCQNPDKYDGGGKTICVLDTDAGVDCANHNPHDGDLLAAAPDMLKALEVADKEFDEVIDCEECGACSIVANRGKKAIAAAIKKAKGE